MSLFLFKLSLIFSFFCFILSLINQTPYYNNFFFYKNSSLIEYYLRKSINLNNENNLDYLGFSPDFFNKLISFISDFWIETGILPPSYIFNANLSKCVSTIVNVGNTPNLFNVYVEGSGKQMNDLGNEQYCLDNIFINKKEDVEEDSDENNIHGITYYLLLAYLENTDRLLNEEDKNLMEFLNQNYFYMGFCLPLNCTDIIKQLIYEEKYFIDYIYSNLSVSNFTITNHNISSKIYYNLYNTSITLKDFFIILFLIKLIVGFLRIIFITNGFERYYNDKSEKKKGKNNISLISIDGKKEDNDIYENDNENEKKELIEKEDGQKRKSSNKSNSNESNDDNNEIKDIYYDYIYGLSAKNESKLYNPFYDNQDNYPLELKLIKYNDLFDNIKTLITLSNKYYNSCNIKKIYFLKFIVMFMSIVFRLMLSQSKLPTKNFLVYNFYQNFLFFLIKICIFSSVFWIVLDAIITGFKLMSYIKKKIGSSEDYNLKFISLIKFLFLIIPKMFLFILCFFFLHLYSNHLTYSLIDKRHLGPFTYYITTLQNDTYTVRNKEKNFLLNLKYLVPFWINYIDYFADLNQTSKILINGSNNSWDRNISNYTYYEFEKTGYKIPSPFLTNTELFVNVYLNEFILFIFMIMITYLSYKIRNKLFDYCILVINIILYILPIFNWTNFDFDEYNKDGEYNSEKIQKYTLPYVFGQNFSEKYTHYFINFYYFGFIIGVMMFYYNENINSSLNNNIYSHNSSLDGIGESTNTNLLNLLPFSFCNDFIMALHKIKFYIKRIILWVSIFFIFLISCSFYFIQKNCPYKNDEENICLEKINKPIIKFIFLYEKNLCCIFFFISVLIFIVYPSNTNLIKFSQINFFIIFERISFSYFCSFSYLTYATFCVFYLDIKINYINVFLNSLGLFMLFTGINIIIVVLFELPIRMLIKSLMNKNVEKEFKISFASGGLLSQSQSNRITSIK